MKEHDFLSALGKVPQEMLDELAQWQESGTPLTDHLPELDTSDPATEPVTEPEIRQRRNKPMKQTRKQNAPPVRLLPWTVGIGAAMTACLVAAVSVGREAIGRQDSMQTGFSNGDSTIGLSEQMPYEEIAIEKPGWFNGDEIAVPDEGLVQVVRNMDDAAPLIEVLSAEYSEGAAFTMSDYLNADWLAAYDVVLMGYQDECYPDSTFYGYHDGTVTEEGELRLEFSIFTMIPSPETKVEIEKQPYNHYYFFSVPKEVLPAITEWELIFAEYSLGERTEDVLFDMLNDDGTLSEYLTSNPVYQNYNASVEGQRYLRKLPAKTDVPEDCVEIVEVEAEPLPEPLLAGNWNHYKGNDISIPADGTVAVIRTPEDAKAYRTFGNQRDEWLQITLSNPWLEGSDDGETEPHDVIFIGMPANKMPDNTTRWNYHAGTVTPSGKLHLDFSVLSLNEMPEAIDYDNTTNFYYFISVPKGALPEITEWDVTFTEYRSDDYPDAATLAKPHVASKAGGNTPLEDWLYSLPEFDNFMHSVLCGKYINWAYDDEPNTVESVGAVAINLDVPVSRGYGNVIADADAGHTDAYLNYVFDQESSAYAGVADTVEGYRVLRDALDLGNLELVVDRSEQVDVLMLVLPVYAADASTAITDMQISADGVLSVTLNENYRTSNVDTSQDTAAVVWQIMVPHGSVPKITAINLNRELIKDTSDDSLEDRLEFISAAGRMHTIQLTDEPYNPASAITDDGIEGIAPIG